MGDLGMPIRRLEGVPEETPQEQPLFIPEQTPAEAEPEKVEQPA